MQAQANKLVTKPSDILIIVSQSIVFVSLEIWIVVFTNFTSELHKHQKEGGAKDLDEEYNQFNSDPNFGVSYPEIVVAHTLGLTGVCFMIYGEHDTS